MDLRPVTYRAGGGKPGDVQIVNVLFTT